MHLYRKKCLPLQREYILPAYHNPFKLLFENYIPCLRKSGIFRIFATRINFLWLMNENEKRELRERAAIAAMQGLLSGWDLLNEGDPNAARLARIARECADAMVTELC